MDYQKKMEELLASLGDRRPRLLLHACCTPCLSAPLELLSQRFELTVFYYNPNIMPREEYEKRLGEFEKLRRYPFQLVAEPWDNEAFLAAIRGHEGAREGGARCALCFRLRLGRTAERAASEGFDFFGTTLTVSPHKNAALLNSIGEELSAGTSIPWLYSDFKKREGYKRSIQLCRELDIYRQDYCGCRLEA